MTGGPGTPNADVVRELERAVWQALVEGDRAADESLLAEDFLGVYSTGFAGRQDHVDQLSDGPTVVDYSLGVPRLIEIIDGHVAISCEATYRRTGSDAAERMYVTSLWSRRGDRWVNVFSQDTPAVEESDGG